jgi:hypothetical protein
VGPRPGVAKLEALTRKYRALGALRAGRDRAARGPGEPGEVVGAARPAPPAAREALRALAREFPGSLRELDTLGAVELDRRAQAAALAAAGGPHEPWMAWIDAYHAIMRATLHVKGELARGESRPRRSEPTLGDESARALADGASRMAGVTLDARFVLAVAAPPQGRIGMVVMNTVAALFEQPVEAIAHALFPARRSL